jgi:hypothetical protein
MGCGVSDLRFDPSARMRLHHVVQTFLFLFVEDAVRFVQLCIKDWYRKNLLA